ncbi:MAG: ankyrin repeat domain-containing protein [Chitinophagaceae bacterium]
MRRSLLRLSILITILLCGANSFSQTISPLLQAIKNNKLKEVNSLSKKGANISVKDEDGDNVLMYAALYSTADCMELLLKKGADPNAKNNLGETAMLWSINDTEKMKVLVRYHADVNAKTITGNTALIAACVGFAQKDAVTFLLKNGANPLLKNERQMTALMQLALYGDTATARTLLNSGVNINDTTSLQETALLFAVRSDNAKMVHWLLANGADANIMDSYKAPPLSYAVVLNDVTMVKALLSKTKDINLQDIDGMTFLMWATYGEIDNPEIIQALLDAGAQTNLKDAKGNTALAWSQKKGNTATTALLQKVTDTNK